MEVLKLGSKGYSVLALQKFLNSQGFNIKEDGDFGPKTEAAVKSLQSRLNIVSDGIVGQKTYNAIQSKYGYKFDVSDEIRQARLQEYGPGMFETDLELVFNEALVAYKRSQVSETYLPLIAAMKTNLEYIDAQGTSKNTKNMKNIKETFDKLVKSKVYNESIVDDKLQPLLKFLNVIKAGFTTMTLSLNVRSFLRESLQGI